MYTLVKADGFKYGKAPPGNAPWGSPCCLVTVSWTVKGEDVSCACVNSTGRGRTSKVPKPPRTEVLPVRNGSQAKPTRGSKLRRVGFEKNGEPRKGVVSVTLIKRERRFLVSVGTVDISYRTPRLIVKFGRKRQSS